MLALPCKLLFKGLSAAQAPIAGRMLLPWLSCLVCGWLVVFFGLWALCGF